MDLNKNNKEKDSNFDVVKEFKFRSFSKSKKFNINKILKYLLGIMGALFVIFLILVKSNFFKSDLIDFFGGKNEKQEIPQSLVLKTTSGKNINIDNKSSLHLPFIKNQGQIEQEEVKYYAPIFSGNLFVTNESLKYAIDLGDSFQSAQEEEKNEDSLQNKVAFSETFLNSNKEKINLNPKGQNKSQTTTSFFHGSNQDNWKMDVDTNDSVSLGEMYNRIDVHLRAYANNVEKLFVVDSGGNPDDILVKIDGVDNLGISDKEELSFSIGDNQITLTKPVAYQEIKKDNGEISKKYITANYVLKDDSSYGFNVGNYDHAKPLIIDPLLSSTYLGGTSDEMYSYDDFGGRIYNGHRSVAEDGDGNIYIIGHSKSSDYPTTLGVIDETYNDTSSTLKNDIVISKFNSDLTQLLASTYLGGTSEDVGSSLIIDGSYLYITGFTRSNNFPVTGGVHDVSFNGGNSDVFVSKLSTDLTSLVASTYVGGSDKEFAYSLMKDGSNLYLAGDTYSNNFPTRTGAYKSTLEGSTDGFLFQMTDDLTTINKTTLVGGTDVDYARKILKSGSNIIIVGQTSSTNFPSVINSFSGSVDGYIALFSSDLSTLSQSSYIGGSQIDLLTSLVEDSSGNFIVTGSSNSTNIGGMTGYSSTNTGYYDGFLIKFDSGFNQIAGTYIGGSNQDDIYEVALDSSGNVYVSGQTYSSDYPVTQYAWKSSLSSNTDGFISKFSNDLSLLSTSTYFGGDGNVDYVLSLLISGDSDEDVIVKGITNSTNLPATSGSYDETLNGGRDIFVSKITNDLRQNAWPDHVEVRYEDPVDTYNNSMTGTAGVNKTISILLKDPFGNLVTEGYDGAYTVVLSGAANSPHGHVPTCNGIDFGDNTTLTFTGGVATCDMNLYAAEIASIDGRVTISAVNYDSTGNADYDLDMNIGHNVLSEIGTSIDAQLNPTTVEDDVTVTVISNDAWGNPLGIDGIGQTVVVDVSGENTATPTVTDQGDGTYVATYTTGTTAGTDQITATLNGNGIQYDEDGTPDGTFNLPLESQSIHHLALRYENPVDTYNDSLSGVAGTTYTLAIIAEDQYGNPVNDYDGLHAITLTGANDSPYANKPTCGGTTLYLGVPRSYNFTDGVAKCNLILYNAETIQLEGTDGTYDTTGSTAYDLDVTIANNTHNHMKITDASGNNEISDSAGTIRAIKVSARDVYGNWISTYDGDHNIIFSGAGTSFNGTIPTVNDKTVTPINFGVATNLTFLDGETSTNMTLYKRENAEIEVADDTAHDSTASTNYDLNVIESSKGVLNAGESTIGVSQDPAGDCGEEAIFVVARDDYGNQLESGGHTVTLTVTGTNPNSFSTPTTITDNGDGSYVASYSPVAGSDQITGTID